MDNLLKSLLESDSLDESLKKNLSEAWEKKLEEARSKIREEVEDEVRSEFTTRFESDREKMVEAMDKFMTESVEKELREFQEDRKEVFASRAKLAKQIREHKNNHKLLLKKTSNVLESFVLQQVQKELNEFQIDKKALAEAKAIAKKQLRETKSNLTNETAGRLAALEKFIIKKVQEEIEEFETDKKELVEQRVRMARDAKAKLDESRKNFIKRSAELVEKHLKKSLKKEFTEMKEDIKIARENHFGRKIFESFAAEYLTSYLSEGSKVKQISNQLDESKKQMSSALKKLDEQQKIISGLNRTLHESKDKSQRAKIMQELIAPLNKGDRVIMEEILNGVKTERLREVYKRSLDAVLKESNNRKVDKQTLSETKRSVATGNKRTDNTVLTENNEAMNESDELMSADIIRLQSLAGVKKI